MKPVLIGYKLVATDAKERMLGDYLEYAPPDPCNKYKSIYEINHLPSNFKLPKKKVDFFVTADGYQLVSEEVKQFCLENKYQGLVFLPLKGTTFFWLKTNNIIEYDYKTAGVLFLGFNKKCNGYREISRIRQICLVDKSPLEDNFYRTDLSFGDAQGKSPLTCIGIETYMKIKKAGFKGVYFDKIFDRYEKLPDLKKQIEAFNRLYK